VAAADLADPAMLGEAEIPVLPDHHFREGAADVHSDQTSHDFLANRRKTSVGAHGSKTEGGKEIHRELDASKFLANFGCF